MKKIIAVHLLLAFAVATLTQNPSALAKENDVIELRCSHRNGDGASFENEVDRITINLLKQEIRLWVTKRNDGWLFGNNTKQILGGKDVTSIYRDALGVIDGTGHNNFVAAAFRYAQEDGRFQWVWIGGGGEIFELEYNCWRIS